MKWLILFAVLFLLNTAPVDTDWLHTPSPGGIAPPFVMVVVLFVVSLGFFKLFRDK